MTNSVTDLPKSWVSVPADSDFPLQNIPFGVFTRSGYGARIGVAIGDHILDVYMITQSGLLDGHVESAREIFSKDTLNDFLAAGRPTWTAARERIQTLLTSGNKEIRDRIRLLDTALCLRSEALMHVPFAVQDYVDFYSSIEHATNLGKMLRPDGDPLTPNYRYIPIGYHGRSSTIVPSATRIVRPHGMMKPPDADAPVYKHSKNIDFELEMGWVAGPGNIFGQQIPAARAREHIAGMVMLNDWSARDIQAFEYQPLGPFLSKSFATSISPWVVMLDALEPFRVDGPVQDPQPAEYLRTAQPWAYDINLQVELQTAMMAAMGIPPVVISKTNFRGMYWNMAQQLAHMTVNGAQIRPGDLNGSGTISGATPDSYGSLMELTWRGTQPIKLESDETRTFIEDGDTIIFKGWCGDGVSQPRIGFGEVTGRVEAY